MGAGEPALAPFTGALWVTPPGVKGVSGVKAGLRYVLPAVDTCWALAAPAKRTAAARMVSFCMVMKKEVWEKE